MLFPWLHIHSTWLSSFPFLFRTDDFLISDARRRILTEEDGCGSMSICFYLHRCLKIGFLMTGLRAFTDSTSRPCFDIKRCVVGRWLVVGSHTTRSELSGVVPYLLCLVPASATCVFVQNAKTTARCTTRRFTERGTTSCATTAHSSSPPLHRATTCCGSGCLATPHFTRLSRLSKASQHTHTHTTQKANQYQCCASFSPSVLILSHHQKRYF